MQFLVIVEARDSLVGAEMVRTLRKEVGAAVQRIQASGKLQAGGMLGARRRLFFLLEAGSAPELVGLLGSEIIDNANCEVNPVSSLEDLAKFFAEHPV